MAANGIWQVTKGVFDRLKRDGVEALIKQKWSNQINDPSSYRAIWKGRARPGCQMPYIVYSVVTDTLISQSTGTGKTRTVGEHSVDPDGQAVQYRQATIQFACYSKVDENSDETVAIDVASLVIDALENGELIFPESTNFLSLTREGDIPLPRNDDESAMHVVSWRVDYEFVINLNRLLA